MTSNAPTIDPVVDALLEPLRRILSQERKRGFADDAVRGGLDWYIEQILAEITPRLRPDQRETIDLFNLGSYAAASDRVQWMAAFGSWMRDLLHQPVPAAPRGLPPRPVAKAAKAPKAEKPAVPDDLDRPLASIKGFDKRNLPKFERLGMTTVRDVLLFYPREHLDRRKPKLLAQLRPGADETVLVSVWEVNLRRIGQRTMVEATVSDGASMMRATWFNQPWVANTLKTNTLVLLSGRVDARAGKLSMTVMDYEVVDGDDSVHSGRIVPVYPLTAGLAQRTIRRLAKPIVERYAAMLPDHLPASIRERDHLMSYAQAVEQMHFPDTPEKLEEAKRRLAFDELFLVQIGMQRSKREWQDTSRAVPIHVQQDDLDRWIHALPFPLTGAQQRAFSEIRADLAADRPMARLLQGDVGSGKTVMAALALIAAVAEGGQGAILAPTEILANQHLATVSKLLDTLRPGTTVRLLTGSIKGKQRTEILAGVADGSIDVLVGTHAIIEETVTFKRLLLGVVDEQHRFGVAQRAALRKKGEHGDANPHLLVMTATPIPRTLALTVYGDLDLSVLDELPPGRQTIITRLITSEDRREDAYQWVRDEVEEGRQAFVICPLVEESEKIDAKAATVEYERLLGVFPTLRLGLLHGRMKPKEKDAAMEAFRVGDTQVLVSTAVVEVGIDVPNATIMLIEGAERFGLSQLHQFRGRVGRGSEKSYCILLSEAAGSERLRIVERTSDGFLLAEEDLRLRGPGEFFGVRQSGLPELRVARMSDVPLVELAREEAETLFDTDPQLDNPDNADLRAAVERLWRDGAGDRS